MRSAWTGTIAVILLLALPAAASAAPTCVEGPQIVENTYYGTPCDDVIRAPRSVTAVFGEGGNDRLYGQRGNDSLFGGEGNDRLYGGVGDDRLRGGPGEDRLFGGFGADSLDGEAGNDLARGDATIDRIDDSGGGVDTLSFAAGVTPGFPNSGGFFTNAGFPAGAEGRGVYVDLGAGFANNGLAPSGGGVDEPLEPATNFGNFEVVIGTAFPDYIVGTADAETFYGGGGADLIDGNGGGDVARGGAEGDGCVEVSDEDCEFNNEEIDPRDPGAIAVGVMAPVSNAGPALYLTGSDQADRVIASYAPDEGVVRFSLALGSQGQFDAGLATAGGCSPPAGGAVACTVSEPPDSILLAGLVGDDVLLASAFPEAVTVVLLGNQDGDQLTGGETEDILIDGAGEDLVNAAGRDDAVPNNGGKDILHAGAGEDLFISNAVCEGDLIDGGPDRDNANWANFDAPITIDMATHKAGNVGAGGAPDCGGGPFSVLEAIEDIESTNFDDTLIGDGGPNQLLGRKGSDVYFAAAGDDSILANSGNKDPIDADPVIDCGEGFDTAQVDHGNVDATPTGCESIYERDPNSFRPPDTPPDPDPDPEPPTEPGPDPSPTEPVTQPLPTQPVRPGPRSPLTRPLDVKPPQTRILNHPPRLIETSRRVRRVVFRFAANEAGATFRCRLDRGAFRPCLSPRAYRLRPGSHTIRIFAIDPAGNRDRSPVSLEFRIRRIR